jgi:hypothetical protein
MSKDQKLNITPRVYSEHTRRDKKEERPLYVAGPRRVDTKPRMEADNSGQGLINLPQAVQRSPPRELPEEITTPTTTIPAPKPPIRPRSFVAPVGTHGIILFWKQLRNQGALPDARRNAERTTGPDEGTKCGIMAMGREI